MNAPADLHLGALVKSISIENLLQQRNAVLERVASAVALLLEANDLARAAGVGFPTVALCADLSRVETRLTGTYREDDGGERFAEAARLAVDVGGWQHLMSESGLRTLMDAEARREWDKQFSDNKVPELTADNIRRTFADLYSARGEMFERGVIRCFKSLSWSYKTNRPFAFGKRLVLRSVRYQILPGRESAGTRLGSVNHSKTDELDDLTRVLSILDGKPEPDHRNGWYGLLNKVDHTTDPDAENDYMSVRSFRNGNGHVTFKRADLVAKMNRILAKHYPDMLPYDQHQKGEAQ